MIKYTELKSTNRHNLMEVLPLLKPYTVLVEPTSMCNFRCKQCFQSLNQGENYFTQNRKHMPLDRFKRVVEQLADWSGERIKVLKLSLYGEPLLNPDFPEMLRIAHEANIADRIETTSNVSLLNVDIATAMVQCQLDYLRVSIYAVDPVRHKEITSSSISPEKIHENLRILQEVKERLGSQKPFISPKMLDSFDEENERFMTFYKDVADELYLDKPHNWIQINEEKFSDKFYKDRKTIADEDFAAHCTKRIACPMPFTTMTVRCNGDVSPCCVDFIGGTNIDNMDSKSLRDIWLSKKWIEFQKMQLENRKNENFSCARCDVYQSDHYTRDNIDGFPIDRLLCPIE